MKKFNESGYLDPGLHTYTLSNFYFQFVDNFVKSSTRKKILLCLTWLVTAIYIIPIVEIWFGGSFISDKLNPRDIDLCCFLDRLSFQNEEQIMKWSNWIQKAASCIDIYTAFKSSTPSDQYARFYWKGLFGFDRNDRPKGIVILSMEELKNLHTYLS